MIFRDDDIGAHKGKLQRFKDVHSLFLKYDLIHTIAVIVKDFEQDKELIKLLQSQKNISVQVHGWEHYDFTLNEQRLADELPKCIEVIERLFERPTILFPPWNRTNMMVERIARANGLTVLPGKTSISHYLVGIKSDVINFHYWSDECDLLEEAMKKYLKTK